MIPCFIMHLFSQHPLQRIDLDLDCLSCINLFTDAVVTQNMCFVFVSGIIGIVVFLCSIPVGVFAEHQIKMRKQKFSCL